MKLSEKILTLRKKMGLSQEDLANELDISRQAVYKWEADLSLPDLEKLKQLAKLFNVSFDYLMNDDVDVENSQEPAKEYKHTFRGVFNSEVKMALNHVNIDNGFTKERKSSKKKVLEHLMARKNKASNYLKSLGATEIMFVQPISTFAFFYDDAKKVCGFYHTGEVQFVCPIENILGFTFGGGNSSVINTQKSTMFAGFGGTTVFGRGYTPTTTAINDTSAYAVLHYTEDGINIKEYKLDFSMSNICNISYLEQFKYKIDLNSDQLFIADVTQTLTKRLNALQGKIEAYKQLGEQIRKGEFVVDDIDLTTYQNANIKAREEYKEYLLSIEEDAKKADRFYTIKTILTVGSYIFYFALLVGIVAYAYFA